MSKDVVSLLISLNLRSYMKLSKVNIIIFLLTFSFQLSPFSGLAQHWVPDTNKKFSFDAPTIQYLAGTGQKLYAAKDTLYVSGNFSTIGYMKAYCIARYYNGRWDSLRGGVYGEAFAMQYYNGYLYIGGSFNCVFSRGGPYGTEFYWEQVPHTAGVAKWDGNQWYALDTTDGCGSFCIMDMQLFNNILIFGAHYWVYGSYGVRGFDGTNWIDVGSLPRVATLGKFNDKLYAGQTDPAFLAEYQGNGIWDFYALNNYYPMSTGRLLTDTINNFLYVGGDFIKAGNPPMSSYKTAMWDGFQWHSMGGYFSNCPFKFKIYRGYLHAATNFDTLLNGEGINCIGRWDWDSFRWYPLGSGLKGGYNGSYACDLEVFHDTLFVTGNFTIAGGDSAIGLARWYAPPDTNCAFLRPMIHTLALQDTFYLSQGHAQVQFFNNNSYAQSWYWDFGDGGTSYTKDPIHTYTDTGTYNVRVSVTHKMIDDTTRTCSKTATKTIYIKRPIGIDVIDVSKLNFVVYPNPTTSNLILECTLPENKTGWIKTYNSYGSFLGQFALEAGCNHLIIPADEWITNVILCGLYIDGKQILVEKVVKN